MPSIAECLATLRYFYTPFRTDIWIGDGFRDAFTLRTNWWDSDVIGLDQVPILIMVENCSQKVWQVFAQNPEVQRGLAAAGFTRLAGSCVGQFHSELANHERAFLSS